MSLHIPVPLLKLREEMGDPRSSELVERGNKLAMDARWQRQLAQRRAWKFVAKTVLRFGSARNS